MDTDYYIVYGKNEFQSDWFTTHHIQTLKHAEFYFSIFETKYDECKIYHFDSEGQAYHPDLIKSKGL